MATDGHFEFAAGARDAAEASIRRAEAEADLIDLDDIGEAMGVEVELGAAPPHDSGTDLAELQAELGASPRPQESPRSALADARAELRAWAEAMRDAFHDSCWSRAPKTQVLEPISEYPLEWPRWRVDSERCREAIREDRARAQGQCSSATAGAAVASSSASGTSMEVDAGAAPPAAAPDPGARSAGALELAGACWGRQEEGEVAAAAVQQLHVAGDGPALQECEAAAAAAASFATALRPPCFTGACKSPPQQGRRAAGTILGTRSRNTLQRRCSADPEDEDEDETAPPTGLDGHSFRRRSEPGRNWMEPSPTAGSPLRHPCAQTKVVAVDDLASNLQDLILDTRPCSKYGKVTSHFRVQRFSPMDCLLE